MARVFISYHHDKADTAIALMLFRYLSSKDHDVFLDAKGIQIGDTWHKEIQRNVAEAPYFIALISLGYFTSDYIVKNEYTVAAGLLDKDQTRRILQVNLAYNGRPPEDVKATYERLQWLDWKSEQDTQFILEKIEEQLPPVVLPFRGMRWYGAADLQIFRDLGRQEEIKKFSGLIGNSARHFFMIHGVSGAGKSSFIRAGMLPLSNGGAEVFEMDKFNGQYMEQLPAGAFSVLYLDQFEQALIRFARDPPMIRNFIHLCGEWVQEVQGRKIVFCLRDEYRTAFETMLPGVVSNETSFPLLAFEPRIASEVLSVLLRRSQVEYDANFIPVLCSEQLKGGVPPLVLPAILQLITQYFRSHGLSLNRPAWDGLSSKEKALFEDHIENTVLKRLPPGISRVAATRALEALTSGNVHGGFRSISEMANELDLEPEIIRITMETAALPLARVVVVDIDILQDKVRYRLIHDLLIPPVIALAAAARLRHERARKTRTIVLLGSLLMVTVLAIIGLYIYSNSLTQAKDNATGRGLLASAAGMRNEWPQRSLLFSQEALKYFQEDYQGLTLPTGQALMDGLQSIGGLPLTGDTATLLGVRRSPDGRWALAWSHDGTILWRIDGPTLKKIRLTQAGKINSAAFSPDSRWLATSSDSVSVWQIKDDTIHYFSLLGRVDPEGNYRVGFSPGGSWMVAAGYCWKSGSSGFVKSFPAGNAEVFTFSRDEKNIVYSDRDSLYVMELGSGKKDTLGWASLGNTGFLNFSHTEKWLAQGASDDDEIRIWRMEGPVGGRLRHSSALRLDDRPENLFYGFSFDDHWLVSVNPGDMSPIRLWNLRGSDIPGDTMVFPPTIQGLRTYEQAKASGSDNVGLFDFAKAFTITCSAMDPEGRRLATASGGKIDIWDLEKPGKKPPVMALPAPYLIVSMIFQGNQLLAGTREGPILKWDMNALTPATSLEALKGHELSSSFLSWDTLHNTLISAAVKIPGRDRNYVKSGPEMRLWNLAAGPSAFPLRLHGHIMTPAAASFSPDGKWMISRGSNLLLNLDNKAIIWRLDSPGHIGAARIVNEYEDAVGIAAISDRRAVTVGADIMLLSKRNASELLVWDLNNLAIPLKLSFPEEIRKLDLSRSGRWVTVGAYAPTLCDLDAKPVKMFTTEKYFGSGSEVIVSPDEHYAGVSYADSTFRLFDITGESPVYVHPALQQKVGKVGDWQFSSDGKEVLTVSAKGVVHYWSTATGEESRKEVDPGRVGLKGKYQQITADGRWVMTKVDTSNTFYLYDLFTRPQTAFSLIAPSLPIRFNANSRWVTSTTRNEVRIWDLLSPRFGINGFAIREKDFYADEDDVLSSAVSPDGRWLVTGSRQALRIRDLSALNDHNRILNIPYKNAGEEMNILTISPDSRWLVTTYGKDIALWPLRYEDLLRKAKEVVGRDLAADERAFYLFEPEK